MFIFFEAFIDYIINQDLREFPNLVASECNTENILDHPGRNFEFVPQTHGEIFCDSGIKLEVLAGI